MPLSSLLTKTHLIDGALMLSLNRPEVHNALNSALITALIQTLKQIDQDNTVQAVCLAGSGKHFCAGGDLAWMQQSVENTREENIREAKLLSDLFHTLYSLSKPTIAIIQGAAYGGALGLIACCDIAIAAETAVFSFSEVKLGIIPAVISPYVIKAISERQAKRYFLSAEIFNAHTAHQIGLIHEITQPENLRLKAQEIAELLLKNSPQAIKAVKQLFPAIPAELRQANIELLAEIRTTEEAQQRMQDFLNSARRPRHDTPAQ